MSVSATLISTPTIHEPAARSDIGGRYVAAAVQTGIGGIVSRVLQGFAPIILARYLGPREYGVYVLVLSLVGIVAGASPLGQDTALQKFLPEYSVKNPARGGAILANTVILFSGAMVVLCAAFFFAANWLASALYHDASLTRVFQFSALLVLTFSLFNLVSSATAGLQDFRSYSQAMIVSSAAFIGFGWLGVWLLGLYGALLGELVASLLGLILLAARGLTLTHQRFPGAFRPQFSGDILKEIFSFAFPAFLAGMLVAPAYWWANTLLARHAGFEQVGLFGVAFTLAQMIMLIPANLSVPAVSFMSEAHSSDHPEGFRTLIDSNLRIVWGITLPMAVTCAVLSSPLIRVIFGKQYGRADVLASFMTFVGLLMVLNSVVGNAIAASGRMWHGFYMNLGWFAVFITVAALLIPIKGAAGLGVAFAFSYCLLTLGAWFYTRSILGVHYKKLGSLVVLTILAPFIAWPLSHSEGIWLLIFGVLTGFGYAAASWRLLFTEAERAGLRAQVRRRSLSGVRQANSALPEADGHGGSIAPRHEIAYTWQHDLTADHNATFFQRPVGLAQEFTVRLLVCGGREIADEVVERVHSHVSPVIFGPLTTLFYPIFCIKTLWQLRRSLSAVYTPCGVTILLGWFAQRFLGMVWVVELWDHLKLEPNCARQTGKPLLSVYYNLRSRILAMLIRKADLTICTGNMGMVADLGIPREKLVVSSNGINTKLCPFPVRREQSNALRAIYVGWVGRSRGADLMFDAVAKLRARGAPVVLTLVGPWIPSDAHWIDESCRRLGQYTISLGRMPHKAVMDMVSHSDVGLFPFPHYEELEYIYPIKVYEYMACGVVPISTNLIGIKDIIQDRSNGFLLKSSTAQELADVLEDLVSNRSVLTPMRRAARRRAEDFEWRVINARLDQLVAARLSARGRPRRNLTEGKPFLRQQVMASDGIRAAEPQSAAD
jgi:O-antigen/teichoic acid export membrane protein